VGYVGSYLWRLRQAVGSAPVLMPGAMVALLDDEDRVLLTQRADDGTWCLPAGAAEEGGSFAATGIEELREETGLQVEREDLVPFGTLSEADLHTVTYPSGDVTHCFAVLLLARAWTGELRLDPAEVAAARFAERAAPPQPLHAPTAHALALLGDFLVSGRFQLR
jgi:8-oxo-dGTP pyrophosphatase MutT (NUDIX family)